MAKLKAPLLSLGASGAIAKAIVFFPWKGLNCAREYVVPANPQTTPQNTQRGYLTIIVGLIHAAQALATNALDETDTMAYALWGSTYPTPRTWFNQAVKHYLDMRVAGKKADVFSGGFTEGKSLSLDIGLSNESAKSGHLNAGKIYYGTSKTALINSKDATINQVSHRITATLTGLTKNIKYFWQFRGTGTVDYIGHTSGIYYGTPTA